MERRARVSSSGLLALGVVLVMAASSAGLPPTSGSERFDGGLVVSSASGKRMVTGSVIAMSGVFNGVGRIHERPNKPGDSAKVSRDDLVFAAGTLHIVNVDRGPGTLAVNRRTCTATFKVPKTTTVDGGTGRFAGATGSFVGAVSGSGVARRKADGSCDQQHLPLIEIATVTGAGTLRF
ncbi:MAG TPA: hypothetical protein VGH35_07620 [Gaiellaceae bacterium]|jgi:hypothetical protein